MTQLPQRTIIARAIFGAASEDDVIDDGNVEQKPWRSISRKLRSIDVINQEGATKARAAGLKVVMDRCPAIEIPRLLS